MQPYGCPAHPNLSANSRKLNYFLKMDFQLVNDTDNPNRFWLRTKDETALHCVVKPKKGYDIVIVIETRKEDTMWIQ